MQIKMIKVCRNWLVLVNPLHTYDKFLVDSVQSSPLYHQVLPRDMFILKMAQHKSTTVLFYNTSVFNQPISQQQKMRLTLTLWVIFYSQKMAKAAFVSFVFHITYNNIPCDVEFMANPRTLIYTILFRWVANDKSFKWSSALQQPMKN